MTPATVLVIDDEKDVVELIRYNLEKGGFDVVAARDGPSGLKAATASPPDAILLDIMMPGLDGLGVCRRLREEPRTARIPIILLTAKAAESDRIVGLELGADDYVVKPFSPRELVARIRALLRRTALVSADSEAIRRGDLIVDTGRHEVTWAGKPVVLTATEFRILHYLAARPGRVCSRSDIIDGAFGRDVAVVDRTVDVHVTALRKKLGKGGDLLETVRGFGYRFHDAGPPRGRSRP
ncbi:MAG TPA: response regulator [Planctomycetota bacterium]|nr:response regulator [Planctomycetota bacterium]